MDRSSACAKEYFRFPLAGGAINVPQIGYQTSCLNRSNQKFEQLEGNRPSDVEAIEGG